MNNVAELRAALGARSPDTKSQDELEAKGFTPHHAQQIAALGTRSRSCLAALLFPASDALDRAPRPHAGQKEP